MKKLFVALALLLSVTSASAQYEAGIFKHLGVGVGVGTPGISFEVATPVTKWAAVRLGLNIMPSIKVKGDVDVDAELDAGYNQSLQISEMQAEASFSRTSVDLMADVYPFGGNFFISAGLSFGGGKLAKIKGHSEEIKDYYETYPQLQNEFDIAIDKYRIPIDRNGDVNGGIKVASVRPYLGLGFGRAVPKNRIGFRVDLGVYFHGKPKVYAGNVDDVIEASKSYLDDDDADDISKVVDKLTVYPVLKFTLRGRIL